MILDAAVDDLAKLFGTADKGYFQIKVFIRIASVHISQVLRNRFVKNKKSQCGVNDFGEHLAVFFFGYPYLNRCVQTNLAVFISHHGFVEVTEYLPFARLACTVDSQIEGAQHHILGGNCDSAAIHRFQQVVG